MSKLDGQSEDVPSTASDNPGRDRMPGDNMGDPLPTEEVTFVAEARVDGTYLKILSTVGSGGMGDVHAAHDLDLGRVVALKVLKERAATDVVLREAFIREAQVTAQLEHPHIVPVYRLDGGVPGAVDETPAFSMKLVKGATLAQVLDRCFARREGQVTGPNTDEDLGIGARLDVFVSVCDAVAYAHERGVIHRDLKPDNVMVGRHGEVYVLDWGIARLIHQSEDPVLPPEGDPEEVDARRTLVGNLLGTPLYMAPEQGRQESADALSDQYALGLILQELVTLDPANPADTAREAVAAAARAARFPMQGPRDLVAIVERACALDPADRYRGVAELVADVRRHRHGLEVSVQRDSPPMRLWRWSRNHPVPTMLVLGTLLSGAAVATIASLAAAIVIQQQATVEERAIADRVSAVSRRSHHIDTILMRHEALLDGFAEQVQIAWTKTRDERAGARLFERETFVSAPPSDYRPSKRYGMPVSFTHPLFLVAPDGDRVQAQEVGHHLESMRHAMRRVFLRASSEEATLLPMAEADALLRDEGVPPVWIYIGLESGVLMNYPGHPNLSEAFDPRARPWYRETKNTRGARWGAPYQGDSGYSILLPCNRALHGTDGQLLGVVGLDVTLDDVISLLDIDLEGVQETYLVDSQGQVVVASSQRGLNHGAGLHANEALTRVPLPFEEAREAIRNGSDAGHLEVDDGLLVYDKMDALGWIYAVHVEN